MYRIKIEEKNNGEKSYTPQKEELWVSGGWVKRQEMRWYNIIHSHGYTFGLSQTVGASYKTEEGALKIIEAYKNKDIIEEGNKVKSTTYKTID